MERRFKWTLSRFIFDNNSELRFENKYLRYFHNYATICFYHYIIGHIFWLSKNYWLEDFIIQIWIKREIGMHNYPIHSSLSACCCCCWGTECCKGFACCTLSSFSSRGLFWHTLTIRSSISSNIFWAPSPHPGGPSWRIWSLVFKVYHWGKTGAWLTINPSASFQKWFMVHNTRLVAERHYESHIFNEWNEMMACIIIVALNMNTSQYFLFRLEI